MDWLETEFIVERMERKAELVVKDVFGEFNISHVLCAFSGGNDSIVSTHWGMNRFPGALVMTADTQIGLQESVNHQNRVIEQCKWDFVRAKGDCEGKPKGWIDSFGGWNEGSTPFEELVFNFGFPGRRQHARMYQRLKERAFSKVKNQLGSRPRKSRILVISGIRKDESSIRAGYKRAWAEQPGMCFVWMNPFYYCTASDFEAYRQEFGLPRNPVKEAVGISGECECGAHAAPGEREAIKAFDPCFDKYLGELEEKVRSYGFPWSWEQGPPQWYMDSKRGQQFLFDAFETKSFMPACVGCNRKAV